VMHHFRSAVSATFTSPDLRQDDVQPLHRSVAAGVCGEAAEDSTIGDGEGKVLFPAPPTAAPGMVCLPPRRGQVPRRTRSGARIDQLQRRRGGRTMCHVQAERRSLHEQKYRAVIQSTCTGRHFSALTVLRQSTDGCYTT
jgi:hypothetical protein